MNVLIDTHIFLWWLDNNKQLSQKARQIIMDVNNIIYISTVSLWEISIKKSLEKLQFNFDIEEAVKLNNFEILTIQAKHALVVENLPYHHADPFDRMLIAQAKSDNLTLLSADKNMKLYEVNLIFALK